MILLALTFPDGLLGFSDLKNYVLEQDREDNLFLWLKSVDKPDVKFPVIKTLDHGGNIVGLSQADLEKVGPASSPTGFEYLSIVTIPDDCLSMTANFKAPIVINLDTNKAFQCILNKSEGRIREPIFNRLRESVLKKQEVDIAARAGK